jgi:redox-sensitive bicupin YhaK (pirin superfamily)
MSVNVISKEHQAYGAFNGGEIIENKPIGFPQDGGEGKPYSNLFYWAYAEAKVDSTIGLHPHQGFEIMSFVLNGSIRHYDTKLKEWRSLSAGDAQIIRAGNGISHEEHMEKDAVMFQIWIDPNLDKSLQQPASYDDHKSKDFPVSSFDNYQVKTYSGEGAPLKTDTPGMVIKEIFFERGFEQALSLDKIYSIYVRKGSLSVNGSPAKKDDFVVIKESEKMVVESDEPGTLFIIESLLDPGYKTYVEIMQERMKGK